MNMQFHYTSNSRECIGVSGEALQLHAVYKKLYFLLQVTQESVLVLQVTWKSVSDITKSVSDITSTKLYRKKYHLFVAVGIVTRAVHL